MTREMRDKAEALPKGNLSTRPPVSNFSCFCQVPLDIAMLGFALTDIVYFTSFALLCWTLVSQEIFESEKESLMKRIKNDRDLDFDHVRLLSITKEIARNRTTSEPHSLQLESFQEQTTTSTPLLPYYLDNVEAARRYSKIAKITFKLGLDQEIDKECGRRYYYDFLYGHELELTRDLFGKVVSKAILGSLMFAASGSILLFAVSVFRGSITSKVLIVTFWSFQLIPILFMYHAAVMSLSKRFCILQFGIGKHLRGQNLIAGALVWPLILYKPVEMYIWGKYIRVLLTNLDGKPSDGTLETNEVVKNQKCLDLSV